MRDSKRGVLEVVVLKSEAPDPGDEVHLKTYTVVAASSAPEICAAALELMVEGDNAERPFVVGSLSVELSLPVESDSDSGGGLGMALMECEDPIVGKAVLTMIEEAGA